MQQAGKYSYTVPATVFTFSDIGLSMHSYLDTIDIFTQSLKNGVALDKVEIRLLDEKVGLFLKLKPIVKDMRHLIKVIKLVY